MFFLASHWSFHTVWMKCGSPPPPRAPGALLLFIASTDAPPLSNREWMLLQKWSLRPLAVWATPNSRPGTLPVPWLITQPLSTIFQPRRHSATGLQPASLWTST